MGLFALALIILAEFRLLNRSSHLTAAVICGLVVSTLVFIFSIFVSWRQNKCLYKILAVIILLFPIGISGLAIWALASRSQIIEDLGQLWASQNNEDVVLSTALQDAFHCCGWNVANNCTDDSQKTCNETIGDSLRRYADGIAGGLLAFALVLIVGVIVAFWMSGRPVEGSDELESRISGFTDPLVLGPFQESGSRDGNRYYW
jgi:hypothetical protein